MSDHPEEHEDLIRAVVVGDVLPDAPEVEERSASCPVCAAELGRLARTQSLLADEAQEDAELLALAAEMGRAPGGDRIAAFTDHPEFGRYQAKDRGPSGLRGWLLTAGVAAAAAAVVLLVLNAGDGAPPIEPVPGGTGPLLSDSSVALEPFDGFDDDLVLRFAPGSAIEADVAEYEVVVEGAGADYRRTFFTADQQWSDPTEVREFPPTISVTVHAKDVAGTVIGSSEPVSGRRSP
ncbi:MAG: hypothetical protein AAF682_02260 [Planctomycetota bacterium]